MKIDPTITPLSKAPSKAGALPAKDGAARAATTAVDAKAPVDLTPMTAEAHQLQVQLTQPGNDDFDVARVAEIRRAISEERYQINPGKIADGLIDSVRELLHK